MPFYLLLLLTLSLAPVGASTFVGVANNGSVARIPIRAVQTHAEEAPRVFFDNLQLLMTKEPHITADGTAEGAGTELWWFAYLGIPFSSANHITITLEDTSTELIVALNAKEYGSSHITITEKRYTQPLSSQDFQRISDEQFKINAVRYHYRPVEHKPFPMVLPVLAPASTPYGFQRYVNGKRSSVHRGLDLAATTGTEIRSPLAGRVGVAQDLFYTGLTVIIDHGFGMNSLLGHMDSIAVEPGDYVEPGQVVGTVGNTGRSTGPHLHWGLALNGQLIDPEFFLKPEQLRSIGRY